jgi:hypothetical protein
MKIKIDTSININNCLLRKVENYSKNFGMAKQEIILKVLAHFIKRSREGVFIKRPTVGYQRKSGDYKKLTLHLDVRELEIFKQIRVVTLLSTSYIFFIAMDIFGDKLFKRAKNSKLALRNIHNYHYSGSYPEFTLYTMKTVTLYRYWLSSA